MYSKQQFRFLLLMVIAGLDIVNAAFKVLSCPKECVCVDDHLHIDCRRKHLTNLPDGIPVVVQTLLLDDNFIDLKDGMFEKFTILRELSLSNNRIRRLPNRLFDGMSSLTVLRLSHNDLDYIENVELEAKSLGRLQDLDLSFNRQMELPVKMVENLRSLQVLNVSFNQITNVRFNYAFKNTRSMRTIDLTGNKILWLRDSPFHIASTWYDQSPIGGITLNFTDCNIMSIGQKTFTDFQTIKYLSLAGNRIIDKDEIAKIVKSLENSRIQDLDMSRMLLSNVNAFKDIELIFLTSLDFSQNSISSIEDTFTKLSNLRTLIFRDNRLKTLEGVEYLVTLVKLVASENHLTTLVTGQAVNLTNLSELDLKRNQIAVLGSTLLTNARNLRKLDLSRNEIVDLAALASLKQLQELRLSHNRIDDINTLKVLKSLTYVDLTFNHIKLIQRFTFTNDYQLHYLNISNNLVNNIEEGAFMEHSPTIMDISRNRLINLGKLGFGTTSRLYMKYNYIKGINYETFHNAKSLLLLDLSQNRITTLNASLTKLSTLSYLDLSHNPMEKYLGNTGNGQTELSKLRRLRVLGLSSTGMPIIQVKLLQSLPRLRQLDVSKNRIIALHPSLLIRQLQLQFLNLSNNRLESVSRRSFEKLPHLQLLDISNNPLHCTCELLRFIRWTFKNNITIMNMDKEKLYRCVWPQAWTDLPMADLHFHMDSCLDDGDRVIVYIAVAFLVILVGLAVILTCYFIKCCIQQEPAKRRDSYDELEGEDNETSWV